MSAQERAEFAAVLGSLLQGPLSVAQVRESFEAILAGAWTPVQVGAFAVALRMRGESAEILVAAAQAMRGAMAVVDHDHDPVLDTCGTGGDGSRTINLSTAAAVVVASVGVHVAKHGNRSVSSQCGSADVVEALGIPIDVATDRQAAVLREARIAFLFAPAHHPALKHAGQARRELGVRTLFNATGPLANPARASHQLVGVYDDALRAAMARALGELGTRGAWVVRSVDGLDEVSPCAETRVTELLEGGALRERVVTPEDFGLARLPREALAGSDAPANAAAILRIVRGEPHPATLAVILNAAAALAIATGEDLKGAAERARRAIVQGAAQETLDTWRAAALRAKAP